MKIFNKFIEFGNFANNRLQKASFCILLFAASVLAQEFNMNNMPPPEASMHYSLGALTKGSSVTVDITIPDNWHVNLVFKGHFQITLPIENVDADYDSLTTQATFHYQACDNSICLAPSQVTFGVGPVGFNKKRASRDDAGNMHGSATSTDANGNANGNAINAPSAAGNATEGAAGTFILLLSALFGGLILNLMPCVLPVLSLKLFSLIKQAGESRKRLLVLGTSTTLGILASFWALAGIVAAVKAGGGNAGWGMQFQSAGFIAFMVVILSAFAMSFFGVFEIWLPGSATTKMDKAGRKQGFWGPRWTKPGASRAFGARFSQAHSSCF